MPDSERVCAHFFADRAPVLIQALKLLGKFGGRNRRFLMDPLELDLKSNPEHGLRLILTFQPATSFLVPLDRCLSLASQNLFNSTCEAFAPEASFEKWSSKFSSLVHVAFDTFLMQGHERGDSFVAKS